MWSGRKEWGEGGIGRRGKGGWAVTEKTRRGWGGKWAKEGRKGRGTGWGGREGWSGSVECGGVVHGCCRLPPTRSRSRSQSRRRHSPLPPPRSATARAPLTVTSLPGWLSDTRRSRREARGVASAFWEDRGSPPGPPHVPFTHPLPRARSVRVVNAVAGSGGSPQHASQPWAKLGARGVPRPTPHRSGRKQLSTRRGMRQLASPLIDTGSCQWAASRKGPSGRRGAGPATGGPMRARRPRLPAELGAGGGWRRPWRRPTTISSNCC